MEYNLFFFTAGWSEIRESNINIYKQILKIAVTNPIWTRYRPTDGNKPQWIGTNDINKLMKRKVELGLVEWGHHQLRVSFDRSKWSETRRKRRKKKATNELPLDWIRPSRLISNEKRHCRTKDSLTWQQVDENPISIFQKVKTISAIPTFVVFPASVCLSLFNHLCWLFIGMFRYL